MKKGFTLVELTAVIIILGVLALITYPIIDKSIKQSKQNSLDRTITSVIDAAYKYSIKNDLGYNSNYQTLSLEQLQSAGFLKTNIINPVTNEALTGCVLYRWDDYDNQYVFEYSETCELPYKDNSGANSPELLNNMIPVYYDGTNWIYADVYEEWYDYDSKEWANAVVLNNGVSKNVGDTISEDEIALWYVWIPRYTYTIFNGNNGSVNEQEIEVEFESGINSSGTVECVDNVSGNGDSSETCTDTTNGSIINGTSTYTHPAFTFGDQELTGFWVGKFEVSGTTDKITIKPNVSSLREQTISSFFNSIQNISTTYSLNGDSHMMKNMEWGSVAYLSHSKYGTCTDGTCSEVAINSSSSYYTGGGTSNEYKTNVTQSTTGNIYGVYDMSGGASEYVMGNMVNSSGSFYSNSSEFSEALNSKYYDSYTYGLSYATQDRGKLGDATKETLKIFGDTYGGWYSDYAYFPNSSNSWFHRGGSCNAGSSAGLFYFSGNVGSSFSYYSARAVICVK